MEEGNFMFVDFEQATNDRTARLISEFNSKTSGSCIHFFMNSIKNDDFKLSVYQRTNIDYNSILWSITGSAGDEFVFYFCST